MIYPGTVKNFRAPDLHEEFQALVITKPKKRDERKHRNKMQCKMYMEGERPPRSSPVAGPQT